MNAAEIQQYWNQRALSQPNTATTNDIWLRYLEVKTLSHVLFQSQCDARTVLDIGCGDGLTTIQLAKAFPEAQFVGWDYAPAMIKLARAHAEQQGCKNIIFQVQDFTEAGAENFDVVLSCRVIINIPGWDEQDKAISKAISLGKSFFAIENFTDSQALFERERELNGLPVIRVHDFNTYIDPAYLILLANYISCPITITDFANAYYYATRIVYSKLCQLLDVQPDYASPYHQAAAQLNEISQPRIAPMKLISM